MIRVENLRKSFGYQVLFDGVSFKLNPKERMGIIGRNGHGKTTLLRLITGEETPDAGAVTSPRHYRIGYLRQELAFTKNTVLEEGATGLGQEEKDHHWKVAKILAGLGFSKDDMQRHPREFAGGFQVRLNLAKVLVSDPDLLLLDEPTNYLDIASVRWVERFLINWPRELILITHDRGFMDKIVTHTLGIYHRNVRKIVGNTEKYYAQMAQEEEVHEKTRLKDERRRREIELFITRFRAKARLANLVQSRIKTLAKKRKKGKLEKLKTLDFAFRSSPYPGKHVMSTRDVAFAYEPQIPLIKNFNITVGAGERICIVGKNGRGKTTLLKLLAGILAPQSGDILRHGAVKQGVFEQTHIKSLDDTRTVEDEILCTHPDVDRQLARNICGAMMFEGDAALKQIRVLSGGEKSRVMLGKLLAVPVNLLLLDEPTHHLDMESADALLAAIDNFAGTVIMVTHNEMFLHTLAERLIVFQGNAVRVFEGGYQRFLEKCGWENDVDAPVAGDKVEPSNNGRARLTKKEMRRRRSELITARAKVLNPLEQRINRIESDIEEREKNLAEMNAAVQEASRMRDGASIAELSQSIHHCQAAIDSLFSELDEHIHEFEKQEALFATKMEQLDSET